MSNAELLTDQPTPTKDDNENIITVSSDQDKSYPHSNSSDKIMSDANTEMKETDKQPSKDKDFHLIKWIDFNFERLPILLQNLNGPCPLLAIFNILLLRKRVKYFFF
jgi:hypothetical protein